MPAAVRRCRGDVAGERHRALEQAGVHERLRHIAAELALVHVVLLGVEGGGPARARFRSNQCAAATGLPHACSTSAIQNPQSRNAPSAWSSGRPSCLNRYT